jgi:hypothetical protein
LVITDILITPVGTTFDIAGVGAFLQAQPCTARDAHEPQTYMIAHSEDDLAQARRDRELDAARFPMTLILVEIHPTQISIAFRLSETAPARRFVEWLQTVYEVRFSDEAFRDITAEAKQVLGCLFG